ncbi:hypothetical protein SH2C18_41760 [Clostridium sediminicola]|uniref:hypothetical protein n=1 Tax=Clostridium sediminicola TaxID=3114879 RepID=UPI0031F1FE3D
MKHKKDKGNGMFLELFDTLFIMILCFGTLLSAMLFKGENISGIKYLFNASTFAVTILCLTVYIIFILIQSDKGLRKLTKHIYKDEVEVE